jgi:glutaredoxin
MLNWEMVLKTQSAKQYIDNYIKEMREMFIQALKQDNPSVDERIIERDANQALVDYIKQVVFEGKQVPIPSITEFKGDKNVE